MVSADDPTTALYGIEKNADAKCSTGSTIKILTCMLAIESGRLDEEATVSDNAVNFNKIFIHIVFVVVPHFAFSLISNIKIVFF